MNEGERGVGVTSQGVRGGGGAVVSEPCRDYLHEKCKGCPGCTCHPEKARTTAVRAHAKSVGIEPAVVADLLAHLRTMHGHHVPVSVPIDEAAKAVRTVIDLGWRPTIRNEEKP